MPTLTVLHTNDLHARFEQMTRIATLIQHERAQAQAEKRLLLVLDAGDSSAAGVWESQVTEGRANYLLLEAMGYDAACLGNADWQWGYGALKRLAGAVHFPLLAANMSLADSGATSESALPQGAPEGLHGYVLFRLEGLTVAVIGLATPLDVQPELRLADPAETLRSLLPQLASEGAQVFIVLSHLGVEADRQLAATVPGTYLLIGGHTHTVLTQPERVGEVALVQAGEFGNYLGRVDITYDEATQAVSLTGALIPCPPSTPPDPTVSGMLELVQFEASVVKKKASNS